MTDNEKREHQRIKCSERIDIVLEDHSSFASEHISNLSEGGVFVRTSAPWPPGTVFSLGMRPSKKLEPIRGTAKVVWVRATEGHDDRPIGMGASFIELESAAIDTIRVLVAEGRAKDEQEVEEVLGEVRVEVEDAELDLYPSGAYDDEPDTSVRKQARQNLISQLALAFAALVVIVLVLLLWLDDPDSSPMASAPVDDGVPIEEVVADPESTVVSVVDGVDPEELSRLDEDEVMSKKLFGAAVSGPRADVGDDSEVKIGATKISNISWADEGDFESLTIRGNADFTAGQIRMTTLTVPPRCLVRIVGIEEPFYRNRIPTTLDRVSAVRLGHHHELDPPELHIVFDLKDSMVTPEGPILEGRNFTIRVK